MTLVHQHDGGIELTVNAQVFRQMRLDIVTCRLMPNERLRIEDLRKRYGVGGSPIREALMRLEAEGLAILEQNKGFRVSPVSREHLLDLMKTRVEIEGLALRWSIEKGGVEWEADLLAAFHRLSHQKKTLRIQGDEINLVWFREHRNFHGALTAACGSPHLSGIRENLFAQAERYVALSIISKCPARNDAGEHEQIMRAALTRNTERAIHLMADHLSRTNERVAKALVPAMSHPIRLRRLISKR
ncbi:MAG TPA: FCD domain-containing protein [Pseudolabrys sp.]|nr:FCD domain-containing protein [Pseudolabrys sp.]